MIFISQSIKNDGKLTVLIHQLINKN